MFDHINVKEDLSVYSLFQIKVCRYCSYKFCVFVSYVQLEGDSFLMNSPDKSQNICNFNIKCFNIVILSSGELFSKNCGRKMYFRFGKWFFVNALQKKAFF